MTTAGPRFRSEVHRGKLAAAVAVAAGRHRTGVSAESPKIRHAGPCHSGSPNSTAAKRAVPASSPVPCARFRL